MAKLPRFKNDVLLSLIGRSPTNKAFHTYYSLLALKTKGYLKSKESWSFLAEKDLIITLLQPINGYQPYWLNPTSTLPSMKSFLPRSLWYLRKAPKIMNQCWIKSELSKQIIRIIASQSACQQPWCWDDSKLFIMLAHHGLKVVKRMFSHK